MPEALIKGMMDLSANDADTETIVLPAEEKWGFRLTGGSEFSMPVTVFQVKEGSRAESVGIKLGDSIIRINGIPTAGMSLNEAQRALEYAGDDLRLTLSNFDDDDNDSPPKEMREVILAGKIKLPTPPPPETPIVIEKPVLKRVVNPEKQKQCWHPVMWHSPPLPNQVEDFGNDKPHGRIVRNVRRFLTECKDPEERQRIIERMFLALPAASKQKEDDPEEEELERQKLAELRRLSLAMRGEIQED
ncbi:PDZ and LIM domain protein 7-like isoform X5 [Culicoides brevitarsis]|uniref:PDZ and LIM domain protein 7-like isoform X5 n=1 Tax=Culicoides brevitarsis TaxID=469753 RepID=UPI00307CC034